MNSIAKKHHFIPQFYLRRWLNQNEILYCYKKNEKYPIELKSSSLKNFCAKNNLYSLKDTISCNPNIVENSFSYIEDKAAKIIEKIEDKKTLTKEEKKDFIVFCTSLFWRSPQGLKELLRRASKIEALNKLKEESFSSEEEYAVYLMFSCELEKEREFYTNASFERFETKNSFLIGDVLPFSNLYSKPTDNYIFNCFALSPYSLLIFYPPKYSENIRKNYNKYIVCNAERFVFSTNREDEDFINKYFK